MSISEIFSLKRKKASLEKEIHQRRKELVELKQEKEIQMLDDDLVSKKSEIRIQDLELNHKRKLEAQQTEATRNLEKAKWDFDNEKGKWEEEKKKLQSDFAEKERKLKEKAEEEKVSYEARAKLKAEQEQAKIQFQADEKNAQLKAAHAEEIAQLKAEHLLEISKLKDENLKAIAKVREECDAKSLDREKTFNDRLNTFLTETAKNSQVTGDKMADMLTKVVAAQSPTNPRSFQIGINHTNKSDDIETVATK